MHAGFTLSETAFATVAGLRGSLTLIMAADFIIHSDFYSGGPVGERGREVLNARGLGWGIGGSSFGCKGPTAGGRVRG